MFESVQALLAEHERTAAAARRPGACTPTRRASKKVNRRYAELSQIVRGARRLAAGRRRPRRRARARQARTRRSPRRCRRSRSASPTAQEKLRRLLIPRDPDDGRDVIMEIKGGEGGEESALFAADLLRMYSHYAESRGWKTEILERHPSDLGGYKDVQVAIKSNATDPSQGVWARLKYEGGVHRVQRVPATESQGRIHTSTTGVLVFPEVDEPEEVEINQNDLKIDVFRSSRPRRADRQHDRLGGAHHAPADRHRRVDAEREEPAAEPRGRHARAARPHPRPAAGGARRGRDRDARKSQIRTMDRSERIRTYNFPENRIADHRTGYKAYNLDAVMNGALEPVIESCIQADEEARLAALGEIRPERGDAASTARRRSTPCATTRIAVLAARGRPDARRRCRAAHRARARAQPRAGAGDGAHRRRGRRPTTRRAVLERRRAPGGPRAAAAHHRAGAPFRSLELAVGPGVFVPRPETEFVAQLAIDALLAVAAPRRRSPSTSAPAAGRSPSPSRPRCRTPRSSPSRTRRAPSSGREQNVRERRRDQPAPRLRRPRRRRCPSSTAPSTSSSRTRRTSRSAPSRATPRCGCTTPRPRSTAARTGWMSCAPSPRPRRRAAAPGRHARARARRAAGRRDRRAAPRRRLPRRGVPPRPARPRPRDDRAALTAARPRDRAQTAACGYSAARPGTGGSPRCARARPRSRSRGGWSRTPAHAAGPSMTVRRNGMSASLISQVAEFHRYEGLWSTA